MKYVQVKICGIRSLTIAEIAIQAGADFLGFNFIQKSSRYINPFYAYKIAKKIQGKVKIVGVFQNMQADSVNHIAHQIGLDFVQLHGKVETYDIERITKPIIKQIVEGERIMLHKNMQYLLLDRAIQGKGERVNVKKARQVSLRYKLFLAGGLTPENVTDVVRMVKPLGVDVASGIETKGQEDIQKIIAFITNAKGRL
jgi:phosphoribosylanthranilate isomerase